MSRSKRRRATVRVSREAREAFNELYPDPSPQEGPPNSTFEMTVTKLEGQTKDPVSMRLDFDGSTTLAQARKLARDLRRALKPYYSIALKVDEDYSSPKGP